MEENPELAIRLEDRFITAWSKWGIEKGRQEGLQLAVFRLFDSGQSVEQIAVLLQMEYNAVRMIIEGERVV
jgi:hypothetical protein